MDRRNFLRHAAVVASGWAGLSGGAVPADDATAMPFGLVTYLWGHDLKLPALLETCERAGVRGVELRTTHAHGVEPSLSTAERNAVRKRFEDSSVACVGPGSDERFDTPDPKKLKRAIDRTKAFLELSADIGGTGVKVKPNNFHSAVPREQTIEQVGTALGRVARFADPLGQEVRMEVHGSIGKDFDALSKIMQVADHPRAGLCWNCNPTDLQGDGLERHFEMVKDALADTLHTGVIDGASYPYEKLATLLRRAGYTGWVLLEARSQPPDDRVAALRRQKRAWKGLVG